MTATISIGDEAPNFDLSSTEGVLLMLCDEVPRTSVLLFFFEDPASESVAAELRALSDQVPALAESGVKVLGISPSKMPALQSLQADNGLRFPLLRDDRSFSDAYGVAASTEEQAAQPALYLVNRQQKVVWVANPVGSVEGVVGEVAAAIKGLGSPTKNYPRSVTNRLVDWWVN